MRTLRYYEFFAGGGMARAGLGSDWTCVFANDFDPMKGRAYAANWGDEHLAVEDVAALAPCRLPGSVDLAWASFPCQDLSLAGDYRGLGDGSTLTRSGVFWPFWRLIRALGGEGRGPRLVVLENVLGVLTSNQGRDFQAIGEALAEGGYRFGALVLDARWFLPQSRPRVFIIAVRRDLEVPKALTATALNPIWTPPRVRAAHAALSARLAEAWIWWALPQSGAAPKRFTDLLEPDPDPALWQSASETLRLLDSMTALQRRKIDHALASGERRVGTLYKRTRTEGPERKVRAEVRFDDIAGCLRTPSGGSSRQRVLIVENGVVRSRLISSREAARLMGLPDTYRLPDRYNDAYHLAGDGVAVPVVRHLADYLLKPLARQVRPPTPAILAAE